MDARGNIYEAPAEKIPAEDTARLEGYLRGKSEAVEQRIGGLDDEGYHPRADPRDTPVTASLDPKVCPRLFMGLGQVTGCYVNEDGDAVWEWAASSIRLTLSTDTMHWHLGLIPEPPAPAPFTVE